MKAAFYTLGCKVNQYDTQVMRNRMEAAGYQIVSFDEEADIYIINTCTVTQISDKKSRQMISRARRKHLGSILVVCGCFAQVAPGEAAALEGVDIVLGTSNRKDILRYIENFRASGHQLIAVDNQDTLEGEEIRSFAEKNRAVLKIEDGCENYCSYCLIPFARGKIRSKSIDQVRLEAQTLAEAGYLEIVLTGIHLASYGKDFGPACLEKAIQAVASVPGIQRIRLGSLEPRIISADFLRAVRPIAALCPHFHLSLQSGCNRILRAMNRRYSTAEYAQSVQLLRETWPNCAITTDIIVGFPGESEEDFEETLAFVQQIGFAKIHIFPFSPRRGTRAAAMDGQVAAEIKNRRVKKLEQLEIRSRKAFWKQLIGTTQLVLAEEEKNGLLNGFSENYCPVQWRGKKECLPVRILIVDADANGLIGQECGN